VLDASGSPAAAALVPSDESLVLAADSEQKTDQKQRERELKGRKRREKCVLGTCAVDAIAELRAQPHDDGIRRFVCHKHVQNK
jgi:hypothetical protein